MARPTVHLIYGFLAAGKTTFATRLAAERGAIRLSTDEWYLRLFADGPTHELDLARWARVQGALNAFWPEVVAGGADVVLDFGFWRRSLRDDVRTRARALGAESRLVWVQCSEEIALQRCLARSGEPGVFLVSETGFHEMKARFEPLGADEVFEVLGTR